MITTARRTSAAIAGLATVGVSSLFVGAMPAAAAPTDACGAAGTLVSPGICEATFTSGTGTFTRTPEMTRLEVLLVGAGGAGADQLPTNAGTNGYAAAGGGGEVSIIDFGPAAASTLTFAVAAPADPVAATPAVVGTVSDGTTTGTVANGADAAFGTETGGASGSGTPGANGTSTSNTPYGAGGGDAGFPPNHADGGAGTIVSTIGAGTLFAGVSTCYGAGGAVGTIVMGSTVQGIPGCGAGGPADSTVLTLNRPAANRGGGGGGLATPQSAADRAGAAGVVVIRWSATATLSFAANGHGTAPAAQTVPAGGTAVRPADPTAAGYQFRGWFTDPQLTVAADFSAPVPASTTYYAGWSPLLAATGVEVGPAVVPASLAALMLGAVLLVLNRRRRAS